MKLDEAQKEEEAGLVELEDAFLSAGGIDSGTGEAGLGETGLSEAGMGEAGMGEAGMGKTSQMIMRTSRKRR